MEKNFSLEKDYKALANSKSWVLVMTGIIGIIATGLTIAVFLGLNMKANAIGNQEFILPENQLNYSVASYYTSFAALIGVIPVCLGSIIGLTKTYFKWRSVKENGIK